MKKDNIVYVVLINGSVQPLSYTSLSNICACYDIPYGSAIKGKRVFVVHEKAVIINEVEVVKISGRENNHKGKRK